MSFMATATASWRPVGITVLVPHAKMSDACGLSGFTDSACRDCLVLSDEAPLTSQRIRSLNVSARICECSKASGVA